MKLHLATAPRFITADGREVLLQARDAVLLAWLALEGPTRRAHLAALLWPNSAPESARNALRQRLFQLRKLVDAELVVGTAQLALAENLTHDLDAASTLLEGERVDLGQEVDAWIVRTRVRLGERERRRLLATADAAEQAGDWQQAVRWAEALLQFDPLREDAYRRLMRVHYFSGDRAAALLAFDRCEQMLKDEVGARPSSETLHLLETITSSDARRSILPQTVPASVLLPPRTIGRQAELARLQQAWAAHQVAAVIGEAGFGKSRLIQDFVQTGQDVVGAAGRPGDAGVPFATLARLLRAVVSRSTGFRPIEETLSFSTRSELARVLPELDPAHARALGEGQRLVMQQALRAFLDAQDGLAGLWVDDLHFADEASLEMLRALIDEESPQQGRTPLRWIVAYRPAEAGSPVQALHDALAEHARLVPVVLGPLDEPALAALVDSLGLPGISGAALASSLARRTGGNPLFVLETLKQAWVERRLEQLADTSSLPRPLSVGRLIERRLGQLSPGALALARVASIAGPDFSIAMAEHVLNATAMHFADALNELESAQIMRDSVFAHDLVFDAVRASVPAAVAAHTHERIAAWLEPGNAEPARIAQHWIDAGKPQNAREWLQRAAEKARDAFRYKEFVAFLTRKSEIEAAAGDRSTAFDTLLQAAEAQADTIRDPVLTAAHCDQLERLASRPAQSVQVLLQRATSMCELDAVRAIDYARAALRQALQLEDARLVAQARLALGYALATVGGHDAEAVSHFLACSSWANEHGSVRQRADLHGTLGVLYDNLGRLDEAVPCHDTALRIALENGNLHDASVALSNLACNRLDAGDLVEARRSLERSLQLTGQFDEYRANLGLHHAMLVLMDCQDGLYGSALQRAELALDLVQRYAPARSAEAHLRLAEVWAHLGQWARVQAILDAPAIRALDRPKVLVSVAVLRHRLRLARRQPVGDSLARALSSLSADARPDLRLPLLLEHAFTLRPSDAYREVEAVLDQAVAVQHEGTVFAAHVRASGLMANIDPAIAVRHARAAVALAPRRRSTALMPAERWLLPARALLAAGEHSEAEALVAAGHDWVNRTAADHVPPQFREGFLHRNPVNNELLLLARGFRSTSA